MSGFECETPAEVTGEAVQKTGEQPRHSMHRQNTKYANRAEELFNSYRKQTQDVHFSLRIYSCPRQTGALYCNRV